MSKSQFVSTLILLVFLNLIIKAFFIFGIDLQVQQSVGPSTYGLYFTLLNLCYIFQIINDFGLNILHNTDTAAQGYVRKEKWMQMLRLKIVLSITYAVIVVVVATSLGYMYAWKLLGWMILNNILVSLILILRAGISGTARYKTDAIISVLDKALMIIFCGFLLLSFSDFQIEWFVWSQTASLVITATIAWFISSGFISNIKIALQKVQFKAILREAAPVTLLTFLMYLYTRSDSVLIEQLLPEGAYSVGVYAAGFRLLDAANMIAFLFSPLLIPMYVRLRSERIQTIQLMQLASGIMLFMTGLISVGCFFWAREIILLCYGTSEEAWVFTFRLLILSHIPIGLMFVFSSYLTAMRKFARQNLLFTGSVVLNFVLNFILIPKWATIGAATAALITQTFTTIGLIMLSHGALKEKIQVVLVLKAAAYFIILIASGWFLASTPFLWIPELVLFCMIGLLSAFLLQLLRWDSFSDLIRKRKEIVEHRA